MVNLIGISGYAGSGKDLVGRIIQYLVFKQDTESVEEFDINISEYGKFWSGWEIKKYATKLKQIASILTGIPVEKFEDQEFKKTSLGKEWIIDKGPDLISPMSGKDHQYKRFEFPLTVREILQKLGKEAIRDQIHPNAWGNALFSDYTENSKWIITDVRFQNEADIARSKGAVLIRVNRKGVGAINNHPSETALDNYKFDYEIENHGSIPELIEQVKALMTLIGVLKK